MTIKQIHDHDLNPEQQRKFGEIIAIRSRNHERIAKIEHYGSGVDIQTARTEHLIASLVAFGVLTVDQVLEMYRDWELELRTQTKEMLAIVEARVAEARKAATQPKLIIPGR